MIRLNVGCGGDLLENYVNIDRHTKEEIEARYGRKLSENIVVQDLDIFNLPHKDGAVDEVLCLGFLEHLSFEEEGRFLKEVERVLKKGGVFHFTVPDFDNLCRQWLEAKDDFKEFYQLRTDEHWFGQGDRNMKNKWGYLAAFFFGNQYGEGQFHRNAYTEKKIERIMEMLGFSYVVTYFFFKETKALMLKCVAIKK